MSTDGIIIEIVHGDTQSYELTITDCRRRKVILSTGTLVFTGKEREDSEDALFVKTPGAGITYSVEPDEENICTLVLGPDDLTDVPNAYGNIACDARFWRDSKGRTAMRVTLRVFPSIGTDPDAS